MLYNIIVQRFDPDAIAAATNNYSKDAKLGEGGYGEVYKATINGSFVAVKRLSLVSTYYSCSHCHSSACPYRQGPEHCLPQNQELSLTPPLRP